MPVFSDDEMDSIVSEEPTARPKGGAKPPAEVKGSIGFLPEGGEAPPRDIRPKPAPVAAGDRPPIKDYAAAKAAEAGLNPQWFQGIIDYESGWDHKRWGGKGNGYFGLIQYGKREREKYHIDTKNPDPYHQVDQAIQFLKDRGYKPEMSLADMYSTVNAGAPGLYNRSDGNATVAQHARNIAERIGAQEGGIAPAAATVPVVEAAAQPAAKGAKPPSEDQTIDELVSGILGPPPKATAPTPLPAPTPAAAIAPPPSAVAPAPLVGAAEGPRVMPATLTGGVTPEQAGIPTAPVTPGGITPERVPPIGFAKNALLSAVPFGLGPQAVASGLAGTEALFHGRPYGETRENLLRGIEQRQQEYEQQYPTRAFWSRAAGEMVPALAGGALAGAGLKGAALATPRLAPAANFLLGTAGEGAPGVAGRALRGASNVAGGAAQAAIGELATGRNPIAEGWKPLALGGAIGGLAGAVGSRAATEPLRATVTPHVQEANDAYRAAAQATNAARRARGLPAIPENLPVAEIISSPSARALVESLAGKDEAGMVEGANKALAQRLGVLDEVENRNLGGIADASVLRTAESRINNRYRAIEQVPASALPPDAGLARDLTNLDQAFRQEYAGAATADKRRALEHAYARFHEMLPAFGNGQVSGAVLREFQRTGGPIDKMHSVPDVAGEATTHGVRFALDMDRAITNWLDRVNPAFSQEIQETNGAYRALKAVEKVAGGKAGVQQSRGIVSPADIGTALKTARLPRDWDAFARAYTYMPKTDMRGAVVRPASQLFHTVVNHIANLPMASKFGGIGTSTAYAIYSGIADMEHILGGVGLGAGVALGTGAAASLAGKGYGAFLNSPLYRNMLMENTARRAAGLPAVHQILNPFIPAAEPFARPEQGAGNPLQEQGR